MNLKKGLHRALTVITGCLSLFFAGMVCLNSPLVSQETTYKGITELSKSNDYGLSYATICFGEDGHEKAASALANLYGSNFSGHEQIIPTALDPETNEMKCFHAGLGDVSMRSVHIGNLSVYSNQKALRRFETAWINVYDNDTFSPHARAENSDGFVFLPDFYADELIANSEGSYQHYSDLLADRDSQGNLTDLHYLSVTDGTTKIKWTIVGVYHAKGFNETYLGETFTYNDGNFGAAINSFGAPFLIAYGSSLATKSVNGLTVFTDAKQYSLEEKTRSIAIYDKDKTSSFTFYSANEGSVQKAERYSSVSVAFLLRGDVPPMYFVHMVLAIVCVAIFFYLTKRLPYEKPWGFLGFTAAGPFALSLVGSLCANFLGAKLPFLHSFFSCYFGLFTLAILGIAIWFFLYKAKKKREAANEK